jgi:hypothetical protein
VGRLTCEPFEEGERRGYCITGQGSYATILPGEGHPTVVVTPGGLVVPAEEFLAATLAGEAVA